MSDQLRRTLDAAAPTSVAAPDVVGLWRRGRRRRRTGQATAAVACLVLFVSVGWTVQQVTGPSSLEVVGSPDDSGVPDVSMQGDAVWRAPADSALNAVEKFTAEAFGWSAGQYTVEGLEDGPGPMFVTVSTSPGDVRVNIMLATGQGDLWQIFQVQTEGGRSGTMTQESIEKPVPDGAATMDIHAWVDGHTVHANGPATSTIMLSQVGVEHPDALGGGLVVYRDDDGNVVGASGGVWGLGGIEPTEPSHTPPG